MEILFKDILLLAQQVKASDIHIRTGKVPVMRVDGNLRSLEGFSKITQQDILNFLKANLNKKQLLTLRNKKQVDFSISIPGVSRFRGNVFFERGQIAIVLRQIPFKLPTLEEVDLPVGLVSKLLSYPSGLILVTGPTGSGKSTTIAAMLNYLNKVKNYKVITLEDPIEFLFRDDKCDFVQRELGSDFFSFYEGLKAALRQDPDLIFVGEMRDVETISLALTAAETGHLVISTLHTRSAAETIKRILTSFPQEAQFAIREQFCNVIIAVISQRLIRKGNEPGRVVAREIMFATPAIKNLIRQDQLSQIVTFIESGKDIGMISMNQSLEKIYKKYNVDFEELLYNSYAPEILKDRLFKS